MLNVKMCNGLHAAFDKAMLANFVDPARNSGYNLHIEVFSIGLFMEKSLTLSVTTPCMRCGNHFDTYGHVWSVPGRANVPVCRRYVPCYCSLAADVRSHRAGGATVLVKP